MSDFVKGMDYAALSSAARSLSPVTLNGFQDYSARDIEAVENFISNIRASLSKIDRAIEEARERIAREHNMKVAAE